VLPFSSNSSCNLLHYIVDHPPIHGPVPTLDEVLLPPLSHIHAAKTDDDCPVGAGRVGMVAGDTLFKIVAVWHYKSSSLDGTRCSLLNNDHTLVFGDPCDSALALIRSNARGDPMEELNILHLADHLTDIITMNSSGHFNHHISGRTQPSYKI